LSVTVFQEALDASVAKSFNTFTTKYTKYQTKNKIMLIGEQTVTHTHAHTHICFTAIWTLSRTTRVSRYQIPRQHHTTQLFTGQMPYLLPNQQCQSTEGIGAHTHIQSFYGSSGFCLELPR